MVQKTGNSDYENEPDPARVLETIRRECRQMGEQLAEGEIQELMSEPELMGEYLENLRETFEHFDRVLLRVQESIAK